MRAIGAPRKEIANELQVKASTIETALEKPEAVQEYDVIQRGISDRLIAAVNKAAQRALELMGEACESCRDKPVTLRRLFESITAYQLKVAEISASSRSSASVERITLKHYERPMPPPGALTPEERQKLIRETAFEDSP